MAVGTVRAVDYMVTTAFAANTSGLIGATQVQDGAESAGSLVTSAAGVKTANYTAVITDRGCIVPFNTTTGTTASAATYTIPANASVAFPVNALLGLVWVSTGTVQPAFGVGSITPISPTGTYTARAAGSIIWAWKYATDTWYFFGDLS